jgi:hypothetical protein
MEYVNMIAPAVEETNTLVSFFMQHETLAPFAFIAAIFVIVGASAVVVALIEPVIISCSDRKTLREIIAGLAALVISSTGIICMAVLVLRTSFIAFDPWRETGTELSNTGFVAVLFATIASIAGGMALGHIHASFDFFDYQQPHPTDTRYTANTRPAAALQNTEKQLINLAIVSPDERLKAGHPH